MWEGTETHKETLARKAENQDVRMGYGQAIVHEIAKAGSSTSSRKKASVIPFSFPMPPSRLLSPLPVLRHESHAQQGWYDDGF